MSINIYKVFYFCHKPINKPHAINYKYDFSGLLFFFFFYYFFTMNCFIVNLSLEAPSLENPAGVWGRVCVQREESRRRASSFSPHWICSRIKKEPDGAEDHLKVFLLSVFGPVFHPAKPPDLEPSLVNALGSITEPLSFLCWCAAFFPRLLSDSSHSTLRYRRAVTHYGEAISIRASNTSGFAFPADFPFMGIMGLNDLLPARSIATPL